MIPLSDAAKLTRAHREAVEDLCLHGTTRERLDRVDTAAQAILDLLAWRPMESAPRDGTFVLVETGSGMIATMQFCRAGYWRSHVEGKPGISPIGWLPLPHRRTSHGRT